MAKVKLKVPFTALKGSLSKQSGVYYRMNQSGQVFQCAKPGATLAMVLGQVPYVPPKRERTEAQKASQERFKRVQKWIKEVYGTPLYNKYRKEAKLKSISFRSFLAKKGYEAVKSEESTV